MIVRDVCTLSNKALVKVQQAQERLDESIRNAQKCRDNAKKPI